VDTHVADVSFYELIKAHLVLNLNVKCSKHLNILQDAFIKSDKKYNSWRVVRGKQRIGSVVLVYGDISMSVTQKWQMFVIRE